MWSDVSDLSEFYRSRLGQVARRLITHRIRHLWPNVRGLSVLGVGYATPYLRVFREEAAGVMAVMPAAQGVVRWPENDRSLVCLAEETDLPLADLSVDRLLLVHAVENAEHLRSMMREVWRVLSDSGRVIVVVPNRRGIWARTDRTPFGQGHPYSPSQLSRLLRDTSFTPTQAARALYIPPTRSSALLSAAPAWERIGDRWFQAFAGVTIVEASKQLYGGTLVRQPRRRRPAVILPFPQTATRMNREPAD